MNYATPLAQAFHQIEILKDRKRLEAPDPFIRFTPHEDRRVTVTESKPAQLRVQPSHKSCCRSASIKANIKVSGNYVVITQSFVDKIQAVFRDDRSACKNQNTSPRATAAPLCICNPRPRSDEITFTP